MNANPPALNINAALYFLILILLGLTSCRIAQEAVAETVLTEISIVDPLVKEAGAGEIGTREVGIEPTPSPETLTYTNQVYGFEFEYPGTWTLTEEVNEVVLMNDPNRVSISFRWVDEEVDPYSCHTGIPAGDLIYGDKILFMDQVIPAEVLQFECKSKIVFYGGTGSIEVDDLGFEIALEDLETSSYREIDLSEELMTEAKSIIESFRRIDRADDSAQRPIATETGLTAHLEIPERLTVGEKINLKFTLKNESNTPLYVLKWYTPLEGIGGDIFRVTHHGQTIPYEGILASRTPPTADAYVLLNPGESVSAVVDLAESFDLSKVGEYRIKFISPRISHIALSEAEMASTMDELGPINISSRGVFVELVESPPGEELSLIRTPEEAQEMIEAYLRDQGLDLGIEPILPVEELPNEELWGALRAQVFRVSGGKFLKESFLIKGSYVIQLGTALGGQGLTSVVVADLDQNGQAELFYAYSSGSDIPQSRIGMYAPAYVKNKIIEADIGYLGHLRVYSEDRSRVGVQVVEGDQDTKTLHYLDTIGYLFIEQFDGSVVLGLKIYKLPPEEILEKLIITQDSS